MQNKVAVDIVLLPPEGVADLAIELNKNVGGKIILNKETRFAHLSLAMGVISRDKIEELRSMLEGVVKDFEPLELEVSGAYGGDFSNINNSWYCLDIKKTPALMELHNKIIEGVPSLIKEDAASLEMILDEPKEAITPRLINGYIPNASGENFHPHITIGLREGEYKEGLVGKIEKMSFKVDKLAVAHLGNFCTCRKVLVEISF